MLDSCWGGGQHLHSPQEGGSCSPNFDQGGLHCFLFCIAGPHFCAVNSENDIIVSDFHNHQVKVFDAAGTFKFAFGSNGEGNGQFNAPTGVAVDAKGNILVADWGNSRIQVSTRFIQQKDTSCRASECKRLARKRMEFSAAYRSVQGSFKQKNSLEGPIALNVDSF